MKSNPFASGGRKGDGDAIPPPRRWSNATRGAKVSPHLHLVCAILRHNPPTKISHSPFADSCCPGDRDATVQLSGNGPVHAARDRIFGRRIVCSIAVVSTS